MDKPLVVVNSTPLILLSNIGHLDLLKKLYNKVFIAEAVYHEVTEGGTDKRKNVDFISQNKWIEVTKIQNDNARKTFVTSLHIGEVETMILAMEKSADLCILDDLLARKHAKRLNIKIVGTLGVLIAAKKMKHINEIKPFLDQLISNGMFISNSLYSIALSTADEN
ncbi:MAG: DUF3368 domain-containing protein [Oscillospiraceae bacterium]|nr:DUF3368 domain-containing protein [Oscillospiraceae bacterium]